MVLSPLAYAGRNAPEGGAPLTTVRTAADSYALMRSSARDRVQADGRDQRDNALGTLAGIDRQRQAGRGSDIQGIDVLHIQAGPVALGIGAGVRVDHGAVSLAVPAGRYGNDRDGSDHPPVAQIELAGRIIAIEIPGDAVLADASLRGIICWIRIRGGLI